MGAHLHGVEATVHGKVMQREGETRIELSGTKEVLRLTSLQHKVQWDVKQKREATISEQERGAFASLEALAKRRAGATVRVVGVLVQKPEEKQSLLEVREFREITSPVITPKTEVKTERKKTH